VIQPYWTLPDREGLLHHYKTIATVGLPIVLYNNQKRSGTPLPVALMAEIIEMSDAFVGIKQTSIDDLADTFATLGGLVTVMAKAETELPLGIALGGSSCITFAANVVPDVVVALYRDLLRGPRDQALSFYYTWYPLFQQLIAAPVPSAIVYALNQIGFEFGSPRPPILSLAGAGAETLKSLLKELQVTPVRPEEPPRDVAYQDSVAPRADQKGGLP
jgi:4-hydroxy-tetrahydrodipicolinate synthase